jgi:hypothetical protein
MSSRHPEILEQLNLAGIDADFRGEELLTIDSDRKTNRCTASSLDARQGLRKAILSAVAEGFGTKRVSAAFGVSREVVRALKRQALDANELDPIKKSLAADALDLAHRAIDRMSDEIDEMPRSSLPIVAGVMIDKAQLLSGGVTQRVESVRGADVNAVAAWLKSAINVTASVPALPVEAGEVAALKGLGGLPALPVASTDRVALVASGDWQSPVSCPNALGNEAKRVEGGQITPEKESAQ